MKPLTPLLAISSILFLPDNKPETGAFTDGVPILPGLLTFAPDEDGFTGLVWNGFFTNCPCGPLNLGPNLKPVLVIVPLWRPLVICLFV